MQKTIYLDYNSTTPVDPRVTEAMLPYFQTEFGNPSNTLHSYGWSAENAVKKSTLQVAQLINCKPTELIWTSGATEGNNTVVFGLVRQLKRLHPKEKIHLITSAAEHWSVLNSFYGVSELFENIEITFLPIQSNGQILLDDLQAAIKPETRLVSLIWVNNEIGSINPIEEAAKICHEKKIYFHTDATQAVGKIPVDLQKSFIHFCSFSAHKFYGPKGVGGLFIRQGLEIEPLIVGGGQQNNRRSGTLNVPAIVGAGLAAEICQQELNSDYAKAKSLSAYLVQELQLRIPGTKLNGPSLNERTAFNLSLQLPQMIDLYLSKLTRLAFSQGSACQTAEKTSSHVLKALGLNDLQAQCTIRLSLGRFTTESDIKQAVDVLSSAFRPELNPF